MSTMASQITGASMVYWGADQRKHQSSASLAFVRGIHWWPFFPFERHHGTQILSLAEPKTGHCRQQMPFHCPLTALARAAIWLKTVHVSVQQRYLLTYSYDIVLLSSRLYSHTIYMPNTDYRAFVIIWTENVNVICPTTLSFVIQLWYCITVSPILMIPQFYFPVLQLYEEIWQPPVREHPSPRRGHINFSSVAYAWSRMTKKPDDPGFLNAITHFALSALIPLQDKDKVISVWSHVPNATVRHVSRRMELADCRSTTT